MTTAPADRSGSPWPPIPDRAITITGRPMLPERLIDLDGRPYVSCYLHGTIPADHRCEDSPSDHFCGTAAHPNLGDGGDHDDQGSSHRDWAGMQAAKLAAIAGLHRQQTVSDTTGRCSECQVHWPCPTAHLAHGWGSIDACRTAAWCHHAARALPDPSGTDAHTRPGAAGPVGARPSLEDVKAAIGGDVLVDTERRSPHDHYDAVVSAETIHALLQHVHDHLDGVNATPTPPPPGEEGTRR